MIACSLIFWLRSFRLGTGHPEWFCSISVQPWNSLVHSHSLWPGGAPGCCKDKISGKTMGFMDKNGDYKIKLDTVYGIIFIFHFPSTMELKAVFIEFQAGLSPGADWTLAKIKQNKAALCIFRSYSGTILCMYIYIWLAIGCCFGRWGIVL